MYKLWFPHPTHSRFTRLPFFLAQSCFQYSEWCVANLFPVNLWGWRFGSVPDRVAVELNFLLCGKAKRTLWHTNTKRFKGRGGKEISFESNWVNLATPTTLGPLPSHFANKFPLSIPILFYWVSIWWGQTFGNIDWLVNSLSL